MKKKILLIGSNGYIGSKIYSAFKYDYIFSLVDYCKYEKPIFENTLQVDYKSLTKSFTKKHDVIILLAGDSSVALCKNNFKKSFENNVCNFVNLANKIHKNQKFIYASSSSVYGFTDHPVDEGFVARNNHENYDTTKLMIDDAIQRFDLDYYSLRFGTVNGPAPHTRNDIMLNRMFYYATKNNIVEIFNKNICRPILGISDLCSCIRKIIEAQYSQRGTYNLCSFNASVDELAKATSIKLNVPIKDHGNNIIKPYNFEISNKKFSIQFDMDFKDTAESILDQLIKQSKQSTWISRSENK